MKNFLLLLMFFFLFHSETLYAQHLPIGAEAAGLGHTTVTLKGRMSVFGNAAGLSTVRNKEILAGYDSRYGFLEGLSTISAAYLHPFNKATLALSLSRFGDDLFSQHKLSLSYGHQIDHFSIGMRVSQHQYHMEGTDTRFATVVDMGGIAQILPKLSFGMSISNLNQAVVSHETGEKIPTVLSTGFCFRPDEKLQTLMEVSYALEERPLLKAGIAYQAVKNLTFRSGANTSRTGQFFLGLGLAHSIVEVDYALETHNVLGISQQLNVTYKIRKNAKD
ncbi:hypothetical protein [Catalinimonas niigatensis]|uniref:hypothetical protein n=1 Tax=Catalinimonas niigatensis TaxID=1397264 RepID=UPI0026652959|nr:hypothetical protein [Catalinimonas niigatensis]WPP51411.1 hypothetical protein PZB72_03295 [Catalinimonas niigatensis]